MKRKTLTLLLTLILCLGLVGCATVSKSEAPNEPTNEDKVLTDILLHIKGLLLQPKNL